MDLELLRERARIIRQTRLFFDSRGYLETDTPTLAPDLIPESCLEVFETIRLAPPGSKREKKHYWLVPSPEIWMKRLIARHRTSIYQICKCFRNGESSGAQHSPEFTMLEYYTMEADYKDSITLTEELFRQVGASGDLSPPFIRMTMEEAFDRWAGFDLFKASPADMEEEARRLGLNPPQGSSLEELYNLIFIHAVEPHIKLDKPVILTDYPAFVPCLAKKRPGGETFERWELYARGVELANCFTEETNPGEIRRFIESEKAEKEKSALVKHKVDDDYWNIFSEDISCSGVAMGLDRLIMLLCGRKTLDGVLPFPFD